MRFLATSLALALAAAAAQAAVPYPRLREVGDRVSCQCGCAYTVGSCNMMNCHFRDPVLQKIGDGLERGLSDEEVLEEVYAEYGSETRVEPRGEGFGIVGWTAPFAAFAAGLLVIPWIVRRWRSNAGARSRGPEVPDAVAERYNAEIERDLDQFE